jgi:hypothetical protein
MERTDITYSERRPHVEGSDRLIDLYQRIAPHQNAHQVSNVLRTRDQGYLILRSSSTRPKPAGNAIPQSCKQTWTPRPRPPAQPACSANERPGTSKTGKLASPAQAVPGFPAGARDLARRLVATGRSGRVQRAAPIKTKALIKHYARRITIEQRLAGSSRRFAPTPSPQRSTSTSTSTSCSASWSRPSPPPSGSACPATTPTPPPTPPAPLPGHPGEIICDGNSITVKINRRAYSPVLRQAHLPRRRPPAPLRVRITQGPKDRCGNPR